MLELSKLEHRCSLEQRGRSTWATARRRDRARRNHARASAASRCAGCDATPRPVLGEAELLQLAIANLSRTRSTSHARGRSIEFELQQAAQKVRLVVRDHGPRCRGLRAATARRALLLDAARRPRRASCRARARDSGWPSCAKVVALHGGTLRFANAGARAAHRDRAAAPLDAVSAHPTSRKLHTLHRSSPALHRLAASTTTEAVDEISLAEQTDRAGRA
jgi:hypothetical protein